MKPKSAVFVLLLLQVLSFPMAFAVSVRGVSVISPAANNFVEDKQTTFSCRVEDSSPDIEVVWFVRDPEENRKLLLYIELNRAYNETLKKLNARSESVFSLLMRRDFSGKEIVCKTTRGGHEASRRLPNVKKTIPIEKVQYKSFDCVHGQTFQMRCDVTARRGIVKLVKFRIKDEMYPATKATSLGPELTRYELSYKPAIFVVNIHNGLPVQCVAVKDGGTDYTGNVVSIRKAITVHYFKPKLSARIKKGIIEGDEVIVDFNVFVNQKPKTSDFSVIRVGKISADDKEKFPITDAKLTPLGKLEYQMRLKFKPRVTGIYIIKFETRILTETIAQIVDVIVNPTLPTVSVKMEGDADYLIIEKKDATFLCRVSNGPPNCTVDWLIRDPIRKSNVTSTITSLPDFNLKPQIVDEKNESRITIALEDNYRGKEIVCRETLFGQEGELPFPKEDSTAIDLTKILLIISTVIGVIIVVGVVIKHACGIKCNMMKKSGHCCSREEDTRQDGNLESCHLNPATVEKNDESSRNPEHEAMKCEMA